jgi:hypothetical protein
MIIDRHRLLDLMGCSITDSCSVGGACLTYDIESSIKLQKLVVEGEISSVMSSHLGKRHRCHMDSRLPV